MCVCVCSHVSFDVFWRICLYVSVRRLYVYICIYIYIYMCVCHKHMPIRLTIGRTCMHNAGQYQLHQLQYAKKIYLYEAMFTSSRTEGAEAY